MAFLIAASLLSADFAALGTDIAAAERGGADLLHVDIMDGHFVPNLSMGPPVVKAIRRVATVPLDVHLMLDNPDEYIEAMLEAGAARLGALVRRSEVPVWERAVPLAGEGCYPGGLESNREYLKSSVVADSVEEDDLLPLYDPQTSGGLLVAVPPDRVARLVRSLEEHGASGAVIGEVVEGSGVRVTR